MPQVIEVRESTSDRPPVRGFLHVPELASGDGLCLTHGAGANCESRLLAALADAFCAAGLAVLRFDLPFRQLRPHGPPPRGSAQRDQQNIIDAIAYMRGRVAGRVFVGGHSYGGRQASMIAAEDPSLAAALLLLSYPLHPPNRPDQLRTAHFSGLRTPALFVHGSRDGFATREELASALDLIPARCEVLEVASAGHELLNARNAGELPCTVVNWFQGFVQK